MSCAFESKTFVQSTLGIYRVRRPETSVLYKTIQNDLESWLQERSFNNELPLFIEKEFRLFLRCGILSYGFARAHCAGCGHDFLIAFSCKRRGFCPSCNTRRMVEIAAHLVDEVFPQVPVRQWVLSLPKRFRYFLQHNRGYVRPVLAIMIKAIEKELIRNVPCDSSGCRLGAVSFLQRFGSMLNLHFHFHSCVIDGLFDKEGNFYPIDYLSQDDIKAVEEKVRRKVIRFFLKKGLLEEEEAMNMLSWEHSGFSLNATVRIEAEDREGLERLIRYCARPIFASSRLEKIGEKIRYVLSKRSRGKEWVLDLTPFELLDRLAVLIPPPRLHRHMYHGVLAPNSPLRSRIVFFAGKEIDLRLFWDKVLQKESKEDGFVKQALINETEENRPQKIGWAKLISRIYEVMPLICPICSKERKIIAFIEERTSIEKILISLNEPEYPPKVASARGPPEMKFEYDQRVEYN